eukprot:jgi/Mesen1/8203/ME000442S07477
MASICTSQPSSSADLQTMAEEDAKLFAKMGLGAKDAEVVGGELQSREILMTTIESPSHDGISYRALKDESDLPIIMKLIDQELSEPYSIFTYRYFISQWPQLTLIAYDGVNPVGTIVCKMDLDRSTPRGYIAMLVVLKPYRGKGIATELVARCVSSMHDSGCHEVALEAEVTNEGALALYGNLGFIRAKRLHRYYLNGGDAFRLKLRMAPPSSHNDTDDAAYISDDEMEEEADGAGHVRAHPHEHGPNCRHDHEHSGGGGGGENDHHHHHDDVAAHQHAQPHPHPHQNQHHQQQQQLQQAQQGRHSHPGGEHVHVHGPNCSHAPPPGQRESRPGARQRQERGREHVHGPNCNHGPSHHAPVQTAHTHAHVHGPDCNHGPPAQAPVQTGHVHGPNCNHGPPVQAPVQTAHTHAHVHGPHCNHGPPAQAHGQRGHVHGPGCSHGHEGEGSERGEAPQGADGKSGSASKSSKGRGSSSNKKKNQKKR